MYILVSSFGSGMERFFVLRGEIGSTSAEIELIGVVKKTISAEITSIGVPNLDWCGNRIDWCCEDDHWCGNRLDSRALEREIQSKILYARKRSRYARLDETYAR